MTAGPCAGWCILENDRRAYLDRIGECLEEIRDGESYEVCLTNAVTRADHDRAAADVLVLRTSSPVPYGALLEYPGRRHPERVAERFLTVGGDRVVESSR